MIDPDEVEDLRAEARTARCQDRCQCDVGTWGTCPGPANCPNVAPDDEEEEDDEHP